MIILQLEDNALAPTGEHTLGGIRLPAGVRAQLQGRGLAFIEYPGPYRIECLARDPVLGTNG